MSDPTDIDHEADEPAPTLTDEQRETLAERNAAALQRWEQEYGPFGPVPF